MRLLNKDEVTVFSVLGRTRARTTALRQLIVGGMAVSKARYLLTKIEGLVKAANRRSAMPKILRNLIVVLVAYVLMQYVEPRFHTLLLVPIVFAGLMGLKSIGQYILPSRRVLQDAF